MKLRFFKKKEEIKEIPFETIISGFVEENFDKYAKGITRKSDPEDMDFKIKVNFKRAEGKDFSFVKKGTIVRGNYSLNRANIYINSVGNFADNYEVRIYFYAFDEHGEDVRVVERKVSASTTKELVQKFEKLFFGEIKAILEYFIYWDEIKKIRRTQ